MPHMLIFLCVLMLGMLATCIIGIGIGIGPA